MSARQEFLDLMKRFPQIEDVGVVQLSIHSCVQLIWGFQKNGIVWLNIPLTVKRSYGVGIQVEQEDLNIIIFQKCVGDEDAFSITGCDIHPAGRDCLITGQNGRTSFDTIERILSREKLRFTLSYNKSNWIELLLRN